MTTTTAKQRLDSAGMEELFSALYGKDALSEQKKRYIDLLDAYSARFGSKEARLFSAPGRSEIGGNHTDHNHGKVLAASIQDDCIGAVSEAGATIRIHDLTYGEDFSINTGETKPIPGEKGAAALIRGILAGFKEAGFETGGFDACFSSAIIPASGVSSSAAFEMILCRILNNLYNGGAIPLAGLAAIGQFAENVYWNKASGLQDQMASAAGGLIAIDFENPAKPEVEKIPFDFAAERTRLILVNTGGSHADLSDEYSAIPKEMRSVAKLFGKDCLQGIPVEDLAQNLPAIRKFCGDRAALRAFHFAEENLRVESQIAALKRKDFQSFLRLVRDSGNSSWKWLQNVYVPARCQEEQSLSVGLALTEIFIEKHGLEERAACRVHGGGFAGVIQVFLPDEAVDSYTTWMLSALGKSPDPKENPVHVMGIRPYGALEL